MNVRTAEIDTGIRGRLVSHDQAAALIRSGRCLTAAADEALLRQLPRGNWIAGTIPYFMGQNGGETTRDKVYVSEIGVYAPTPTLCTYTVDDIERIAIDGPENGYSILIMPAGSDVHAFYARNAPEFEGMFLKPIIGWVSGVHLDDLSSRRPQVVNGQQGELYDDRAVVMHVPLPAGKEAAIDLVNLFTQGPGDAIRFPAAGFAAGECLVNGEQRRLSDYIVDRGIDTRLPLVADYCGSMINVSIKSVDEEGGNVEFYAPVFPETDYRFAARVVDYVSGFNSALPDDAGEVEWSCNCILNYLYSDLEGKRTGPMVGPMTFGEIAYQLMNQTMVYLTVRDVG